MEGRSSERWERGRLVPVGAQACQQAAPIADSGAPVVARPPCPAALSCAGSWASRPLLAVCCLSVFNPPTPRPHAPFPAVPCRAVPCRASPPRADGQRQTSGSVPSDTGTWVESSTASRCRIRCIFICRQHSTRHSLRQGVHSGRLPRPLHGKGAGRGPNGGQVFRTRPVPIALSLPAAASSDNTTTPGSAKKNNRQAAAAVPNWTSRTGCHDGCPPECDSNTRTTLLATKNWLRLILGLGFTVDQSLRPGR